MARQAIATRCRTASTWLKFIYLVLAPEFEAMWLEACGAATAGLKAATGQYCVLVVGAELVLILLVAVLVCKNFCPKILLCRLTLCRHVQSAHAVARFFPPGGCSCT